MKRLGIVTCFFNPCGYKKRMRNYEIFRFNIEHPEAQVLTVELAFKDNPFEITSGDILQVRSNSVLWSKERLLNIGIQRLIEDGFDRIVWCDADMVFQDKNWHANIMRALDKNPLVQCFDSAEQCYTNLNHTQHGIAYSLNHPETMRVKDGYFRSVMGGCWAITAEMYKRINKLYDY